MNTSVVAIAGFNSTHDDPVCSEHRHGHDFRVSVTEQGTSLRPLCPTLHAELRSLVNQLDGHVLADMLYGGSQSLDGIAGWVRERLLLAHPTITEVRVEIYERAAVVRWELH